MSMKKIPIASVVSSKIDPNYYIIDAKHHIALFSMITTLTDIQEEKYANILLTFFSMSKDNFQKLFIEKNSDFGMLITNLIKQNEIIEEGKTIFQENVINALVNEIKKENSDPDIMKTLYQLIKTKDIGNIEDLSQKYPRNILEQILLQGSYQDYIRKLNSDQTGLDEEGYFYKDNVWYQLNIRTKKCTPIEEQKRIRKREKIFHKKSK